MTIVLVVLALFVGVSGGVAVATFIDSQLSKKSFGAQFASEESQSLADLSNLVHSIEGKVESLLHITTGAPTSTPAATPTVAPTTAPKS